MIKKTVSSITVLEKLIGSRTNEFELIIESKAQNNLDWFEVETTANCVKIKGAYNTVII